MSNVLITVIIILMSVPAIGIGLFCLILLYAVWQDEKNEKLEVEEKYAYTSTKKKNKGMADA